MSLLYRDLSSVVVLKLGGKQYVLQRKKLVGSVKVTVLKYAHGNYNFVNIKHIAFNIRNTSFKP